MEFTVIIPARFASTRLPEKVLRDVCGKPLIQHVYERAVASAAHRIAIATDDSRIEAATRGFGAQALMTSPDHGSGTDRIAEAADMLGLGDNAIVVNLQGDEPLMPPSVIRQVAALLDRSPHAEVATVCEPIQQPRDVFDPNVVKVVIDARGRALYFSRAPIPWSRQQFAHGEPEALPAEQPYNRHVGLYAYRAGFLRRYRTLTRCELEATEALEQLRVLHHGGSIMVEQACEPTGFGVDTQADLERVCALLQQRSTAL